MKTRAPATGSGRAFFYCEIDVNLIGGAGYGRRFDVDVLKITEAAQSTFRALDLFGRYPPSFELAHFPSQNLVARFRVPKKVHAPYINPLSRIDEISDSYRAVVVVNIRNGINVGERYIPRYRDGR